MKKLILYSLLLSSIALQAQDDVYDAPEPKRVVVYSNEPQSDESNYDPYNNYDYDYNGYNSQDLRYTNRLRRMYAPQSQIFINTNPYSFYNPYATFGYNSFYDPWMSNSFYNPYGFQNSCYNSFYNPYTNYGFNSFYDPFYSYYNPYSYMNPYNTGYYRPYNNWSNRGNNWGGNNYYRPRPQTPRRETPRGFSRSDDTYRPSPARTRPSTTNGGFGAAPSNSSRESNRYSSPSSAPAFPSNNNNSNTNNQGGFGGTNTNTNSNPEPASTPTNGNNRGRTGRF